MTHFGRTALTWLPRRLHAAYLANFLAWPSRRLQTLTPELSALISMWLLEWALLLQYLYGEGARTTFVVPAKVPLALILSLLYWTWLGAMAAWRRTQFGRFTRGERLLWAKALAAFWVAELVTACSVVLLFGWISGGPSPLVPRLFSVSRKNLLVELVAFSYVLAIAASSRTLMKWNSWSSQAGLSCAALVILSYLLWRDALLLIARLDLYDSSAARWRNLRTTAVTLTLAPEWGVTHFLGPRAPASPRPKLIDLLQQKQRPELCRALVVNAYEAANILSPRAASSVLQAACPLLHHCVDYAASATGTGTMGQLPLPYPRRVGFVPKKLGLWHLLMVLKLWHHLLLVLWWSLHIYRLTLRRKTSYNFFNSCAFNVFCCWLLALVVYAVSLFPALELPLKLQPQHYNVHRILLTATDGLEFAASTVTRGRSGHVGLPRHQYMGCTSAK